MPVLYANNKNGESRLIRSLLTPMELRAHTSWVAMRNRCKRTDEGFADIASYHGKGITVCERWIGSFDTFLADMGPCPSPLHSIDRRKNGEGYSPENCKWSTAKEQAINRASTVLVPIGDRTETLSDWERISGVKASTIRKRIKSGRPEHEWLSPEALPHRAGHQIPIDGRVQSAAKWAAEIGVTAPCILYRIKIGLTGRDILNPPPPKMRAPGSGRPKGSVNKPKIPIDDGATRPKESQDASETGRDLHEEDKGERAG